MAIYEAILSNTALILIQLSTLNRNRFVGGWVHLKSTHAKWDESLVINNL